MDAQTEVVGEMPPRETGSEFETLFRAQYGRVARIIARVVHDPARAEELAVEVFLKLWRMPHLQDDHTEAWLSRTAVRQGLDELRRRNRRARYESFLGFLRKPPTPEELRASTEERERVRLVLAIIRPREAELLLLRNHGLGYNELASALNLNPASVGTLLSRAQHAFRKEYAKRYGEQ